MGSSTLNCRRLAAPLLGLLVGATAVSFATGTSAQIASRRTIPSQLYFNAFAAYYDGNYRDALRAFAAESRGGIKTPASRWIDGICYHTMIGECHYQLGNLPQALASYDAALKLYVAYSDWMIRVRFPQAIAPAPPGTVRTTPWGQSRRGARVGQFPETFLMGQGRLDNNQVLQQGGVIQQPVLFPIHAGEIVRCTCLAIRRRRELLGPIGKYDPLTSDLINVLARRPGPANHWSEAWVQVQLGCAYAAAGDAAQAKTALQRSIMVGGQFDHPLTSTALLELGRLALEGGDFPAAAQLFLDSTYASFQFPDLGNMEEAFRYGLLAHLLLNQKAPYPPLAPAIDWVKAQGYRQLQSSLALLMAENMAVLGETAQAANMLSAANSAAARTDLLASQLGARMNHLAALLAYQRGTVTAGDRSLTAALRFGRKASVWMFQIGLADKRYTGGHYSDRVGMALYSVLLRDPTPGDWAYSPLECLSVLTTPHGDVWENWFEAAIGNSREQELALEIADRARRRRFLGTLPLGGRLLALRWILEGPPELAGQRGLLERQELLSHYPRYQQLAQRGTTVRATLAAIPLAADDKDTRDKRAGQLAILADIGQQQEVILRQMAVGREASDLVFPPVRTTAEVQQALGDGVVLMAFFKTRRNLYAWMYSNDQYAAWKIQSPAQLQRQVSTLLREMGNYEANHELSASDLTKQSWRKAAERVRSLLLARSNVELAGNFREIVIVPDDFLWYLPFEVLSVGKEDPRQTLISRARVRYAPTVGLSVPYSRVQKPHPNVGVVLGKLHPKDDESVAPLAFEQLGRAVAGAVALPTPLPAASSMYRLLLDGLIVLDDIQGADGPYDWSPMQLDRGKPGAALADWFSLPWGAPEFVILPGYHTLAESGLRKRSAHGEDLFLPLCGLMASGARTVLISRWRTGGQTSLELVREFAQELPHTTPADAWQRSVHIAGDAPLQGDREPRIRNTVGTDDLPKADHPFFWSGYMLVDSGKLAAGKDQVLALPGLGAPKQDDPAQGGNAAKDALLPAGLAQPPVDAPPDAPGG